jgi:hypothetical protein
MTSSDDADRARREPEIVRLFAQARAEHPTASHTDLIEKVRRQLPRETTVGEVKRIAAWFRLPTHLVC